MFIGTDSYKNMCKIWATYRTQVQAMQDEAFTLNGRGVIVFLGGDWAYLDESVVCLPNFHLASTK